METNLSEEMETKIYAVYEEYEQEKLSLNDIAFFSSQEDALEEFNSRKNAFLKNEEFETSGEFMYCDAVHPDNCVLFIHKRSRYEMYLNISVIDVKGTGRYYVIDRHRQIISLEYVKEYLDKEWFKCFDTYEEAYEYERNAFFDDSDYGIFYRTENDKFLRISGCLS